MELLKTWMLSDCTVLFGEFGEGFALLGELLQQGSRTPDFAMMFLKFADAFVNVTQAHGIRVPHRAAAIGWESVAVEIDDIDVDGPRSKPLFEDARPFVDQGVEAAIHDFFGGDLALRYACLGNPSRDEPCHVR